MTNLEREQAGELRLTQKQIEDLISVLFKHLPISAQRNLLGRLRNEHSWHAKDDDDDEHHRFRVFGSPEDAA